MKKLDKLTKHQLLHLVDAVIGERKTLELFKEVRQLQEKGDMKCWDCIDIERALSNL